MKNYFVAVILLIVVSACKQKTETVVNEDYSEKVLDVTTSVYPENITKVFNAHGGIDLWNTFQTLEFTMKKDSGDEKTTTDLKDRRSLIETETFAIGYTGKEVWLQNKGGNEYKGKPKFYYNLMFYFHAMPFVLADDGITYTNVEPLKAEGKEYPGIKISYGAGVGESPEDEYILYYDTETNKMTWLGYTVTYFTKEKSTEWSFIKYADWQTFNGIVLPTKLEWYKSEGFTIGERSNELLFSDIVLSKDKLEENVFSKPEDAEVIE
ncbi:DUF6503 family protein [uncultured Lacinutrix sp.]|uniref:DUF6503 family protein n=1 Tax=uncultured Lacinutrix sp. TaxID=574032 RepID=UPI002633001E|nr:DUF6503 family protein [uncultured Lacinutrix sp.]